MRILVEGLKNPGGDGVRVKHGQAHSKSKASIYFSPAVGYAAFPVYASLHELSPGHWVQCVLQVRVRPDSFQECTGTLGRKYWPADLRFDPNFNSLEGLEWLLEDAADHEVVGLLVRELGVKVDPSIYGEFASKVNCGLRGPEYELSRLLQEDYRARCLFIS